MAQKLGLVLGSGAARGWAHVGVLRGLDEIGVRPDIIAGCSVGALVGGAYILGCLKEFEAWARELGPLSAFGSFALKVASGGLVDARPAFEAFKDFDRAIEDLPVRFGAVAVDLTTGEEVWLTEGSTLAAVRASSAIPVVLHAVEHQGRWLVDGALANPAPVSLARQMGADIVISVDLNAVPRVLTLEPPPKEEKPRPAASAGGEQSLASSVKAFIDETRRRIDAQRSLAKARILAQPQLFDAAYAAADIFQMHLARARAESCPADITLEPDMRDAFPTSFDRADEFIEEGRRALLDKRGEIESLLRDKVSA